MKRIGVDAGGTFTDAVLWDEDHGLLSSAKVSSRRDDPAGAVVAAARRVLELAGGTDETPESAEALRDLVHGTTIGTNLALERNGPRIALVTTEGFRDVLEIGRLTRPAGSLYDLLDPGPAPLVARRDRFEVAERLDVSGKVLVDLDEEAVRAAGRVIGARGIGSVAVCFLYSHLDGRHERRAAELLQEVVPGLQVSLSSEVMPQVREFERVCATVLNAYLAPVCAPYLDDLTGRVAAWREGVRTWIMQSNGGVASTTRAAETPVNLLLSGPSGGVVAGRLVSHQTGLRNTITVDMGGTSFDVCLIADGVVPVTTTSRTMDLPVQLPTVDIETIGTGGGSIAHVDAGGQFLVGPASAGAVPGPAAYGRGGTEPTVTDANVVLGILADGTRLGDDDSAVVIDRAAALAACARLGEQLGLSAVETALGIRRISNAAMAGAVRAVSVGRGYDPRDFALDAFGGAGPMHACDLALELGIPTVVVPPVAGVLSALGLVVSDIVHDHATSFLGRLGSQTEVALEATFADLTTRAREQLGREGIGGDQTLVLALDLHYAGQNSALTVTVGDVSTPGWSAAVVERFHAQHRRVNGFDVPGEPVDVVVARCSAVGRLTDAESIPPADLVQEIPPVAGSRELVVSPTETVAVPRYLRTDLRPGHEFSGAAVVDSADTTVVIPAGAHSVVDAFGNLLVHVKGTATA